MKIGRWAGLLAAATLVAGCGDFWEAPGGNSSFTLSNSGNITISAGAAGSGTSTITVTPSSSYTGTVTLSCAITSSPSSATSPTTCSLSSSSLTFSSATVQTSTLTATTTATTTAGAYQITVTGVSGSVAESTTVCAVVGSGSCSAANNSGIFYILSNLTAATFQVASYSIASGQLTALSSSPALNGQAYSMAIDPTGHFLYVGTNGGILLYDTGTSGTLTRDTSVLLSDIYPFALQVDSTGHWLLDASNTPGQPTLFAWPISIINGESTLGSNISVPSQYLISGGSVGQGGMAISSDNKLVSVAAGLETQTFGFTSGTDYTGATNPLSSPLDHRTAIGTAVSVSFGPSTSFLYIGETGVYGSSTTDSGALRIIPISSDVLGTEPAVTSTYPYPSGGTGPHAILADSNGYVYVANWVGTGSGNITAFLLNASTPSLALQSNPVSTGVMPYGMAVDSTGNFVLVVNNQGNSPLSAFTFDATTTGKLDTYSLSGSLGAGPVAIVTAP